VTLIRSRKARLMRKAGFEHVDAWLPQKVAADLAPAIAAGDAMVAEVLAESKQGRQGAAALLTVDK